MKASERIAANTAVTYARSVLAVGLALFSSRWILSALGERDFGLFNVVGSLIVFLTFFNGVMASSSARHFAYAIGEGDCEGVNRWFNASLSIHLILPIALVLIGWPIAEYVIRNLLTIPPERIRVCVQVFRFSLISAFVNMVSIPFVAMFRAKQRITEPMFWSVLQSISVFALAWSLTQVPGDRLLFYAAGMVTIFICIHVAQCCRAVWLFPECRIRLKYWLDTDRSRELCGFALWTMIGRCGGMLRNQGSGILLNLYLGPAVNAAYGIANQVSVQTATLSEAMMGAISPEITAREGRGHRDSMISLCMRASKFGTLLVLFLALPLIMEVDFVFKLWLRNPPAHAAVLSQLILVTFLVERLSVGYMYAVSAHGRIAAYQATVGVVLLMTLPLVWLSLELGLPPAGVGLAFILIQTVCSFGRVLWGRYLFGIPLRHWLTDVIRPCVIVAGVACIVTVVPRLLLAPSLPRLLLVCISSVGTMSLISWAFALAPMERSFIRETLRRMMKRIVLQVS